MGQYSIKDLEVLSGIKTHTLRMWEQRYNIVEPLRTDTNIRYYSDSQLKLLLNVSLLNKSGLKISKIAALSPEEIAKSVQNIEKGTLKNDKHINILIDAMISLDKKKMLAVLCRYGDSENLLNFFIEVVFPFLGRIGTMWASESVNPAQEHFASNIIKRFLIDKIDKIEESDPSAKLFLLFLPEGDQHEISLLLAEFLLKFSGKRVLYLGASVPNVDVEKILRLTNVNSLLCVGVLSQDIGFVQQTINECTRVAGGSNVYFAGQTFYHPDLEFPKKVNVLRSFEALIAL